MYTVQVALVGKNKYAVCINPKRVNANSKNTNAYKKIRTPSGFLKIKKKVNFLYNL